MKKMALFVMLILAVLLVCSCGSTAPAPASAPPPTPAPAPAPQPQPQPEPQVVVRENRHHSDIILDGAVNYTVVSGDYLAKIAYRLYQDGSYYPLIMMVSDEIKDPDVIEPGMILTVPDVNRNMSDARAKNSINSFFANIANIEDQRGRHRTADLIRNHTR